MSTHEPTPTSPGAGQESVQDLFRDVHALAEKAAESISQAEVEYRLYRVLRGSGHLPPVTVPDGDTRACALAAAAERSAKEAFLGAAPAPLAISCSPEESRIRKAEQLLTRARREAATLRAEAQQMQAAASKAHNEAQAAHTEAMKSLAAGRQLIDEAQSFIDSALDQAAAIVAEAKAQAEEILHRARAANPANHLPGSMSTPEARQTTFVSGQPSETVALLWDCVLQTMPGDRHAGMVLDADSRNPSLLVWGRDGSHRRDAGLSGEPGAGKSHAADNLGKALLACGAIQTAEFAFAPECTAAVIPPELRRWTTLLKVGARLLADASESGGDPHSRYYLQQQEGQEPRPAGELTDHETPLTIEFLGSCVAAGKAQSGEPQAEHGNLVRLADEYRLATVNPADSGSPASQPAAQRGAVDTAELAKLGLPVRVRQASLAPQPRDRGRGTDGGDRVASAPSPEAARTIMTALQRGWERGRYISGSVQPPSDTTSTEPSGNGAEQNSD